MWGNKYFRNLYIFFVFCLFLFSVFPQSSSINYFSKNTINDEAYLKEIGNIKLLGISGSNYEMGYQHGSLLKEEINEDIRAYLNFSEKSGTSYESLLSIWNEMKEFVPKDITDEMKGLADGSGIDFEKIAVTNIIPVKYHCCGISAWGSATFDGKLYHARSLDYPLNIVDPVTGRYLQENQIMVLRNPDVGFASLYPSFAGMVGCVGGINEEGIAIGQATSRCNDETYLGTPMTFKILEVLDNAESNDEAIDIIISNKTCGYNFIISDGGIPQGFAVETTANTFYIGTWDTPEESTFPCWEIDHVVRRTNFFIGHNTSAMQRKYYNPAMPIFWLFGLNDFYPNWRHYKTLSKAINENLGKLSLNSTMTMLRNVYNGKTDVLIKIATMINLLQTMHQWVACPETGDMLISFASPHKDAFKNSVYKFNLFKLLDKYNNGSCP